MSIETTMTWSFRSAVLAAGLLMIAAAPVSRAAESPPPPVDAEAAQQVAEPARLVERLLGDEPSPVRALDPAIFIELLPVTASEPAVRLPEDQQDTE
jgi:hypothetical protein